MSYLNLYTKNNDCFMIMAMNTLIININLSMLIMVCKNSLSTINTRSNIDTILYFYKTIYRTIVLIISRIFFNNWETVFSDFELDTYIFFKYSINNLYKIEVLV